MDEDSLKWDHLSEGAALGSTTPFLRLPTVLLVRIPHTPDETVVDAMSVEDLSFIQNPHEPDKMELFSKATYHTYQEDSLFSLTPISGGDVMAIMRNPFKERDTWRGEIWGHGAEVQHLHNKIKQKSWRIHSISLCRCLLPSKRTFNPP